MFNKAKMVTVAVDSVFYKQPLTDQTPDIETLPFSEAKFIELLRLEKQRAQRFGSALSILLLTQYNTKRECSGSADISEMLKTVQTNMRETDIVGYIDQHTLGVLLPYTDEEGAKKFAEKIINNHKNQQFAISNSTYPDHIFDSLAKNGCASPDVLKFMLEDSINNSWALLNKSASN